MNDRFICPNGRQILQLKQGREKRMFFSALFILGTYRTSPFLK
ncbi:hypothetical protein HMPREF9372_2730 [Sporosarcina newyorkensis 2681]|uniref:Uncharacterized protein n=1 Tax=Sporosarcina newyorkensis 2681 TaxID=1027292 RepID=F9DV99_9BACL|nr:hypothetical protein HMPREF9372_2730 [Sporosarcina newyorkensis 2681]